MGISRAFVKYLYSMVVLRGTWIFQTMGSKDGFDVEKGEIIRPVQDNGTEIT